MARNPQLEAILRARYEWQTCAEERKEECHRAYERLIEQAVAKGGGKVLREQLEEALIEPYREFKRAKLLEERSKLSRLR